MLYVTANGPLGRLIHNIQHFHLNVFTGSTSFSATYSHYTGNAEEEEKGTTEKKEIY